MAAFLGDPSAPLSLVVRPQVFMQTLALMFVVCLAIVPGAYASDSPEEALKSLEDAYRARDVEAAISAKNFSLEASLMLQQFGPEIASDPQLVEETAEVLELSFRKDLEESGFPDFDGVECEIVNMDPYASNVLRVREVCTFPDGGTSVQHILIGKTNGDWKVLNPIE